MSCRVYSRLRHSSTSSDSYSDCGLPCSISLARMRNFESSSSTFRSSKSQAIRSLSLTRVYTEFPAVALITICGCAWSAAAALRTPRFVLQVPVPLFCPPIPVPAETTRRQHSYNPRFCFNDGTRPLALRPPKPGYRIWISPSSPISPHSFPYVVLDILILPPGCVTIKVQVPLSCPL